MIMITAETAATTQLTRGAPGGTRIAVAMIRTAVSGMTTGITLPNVPSMACCIRIWEVASSRLTMGWTRAQDADSAPVSHPLSMRTSVLSAA